jgi:hypothetical protein
MARIHPVVAAHDPDDDTGGITMTPTAIRPMHRSMNGSQGWARLPPKMKAVEIPSDMKMAVTEIALSIFTDCVNTGKTFQDAILAVYMSGIENGSAITNGERSSGN